MTAGDRVVHKRYGRGTVLSAPAGPTIRVRFEGLGEYSFVPDTPHLRPLSAGEEARQVEAERRGYEQTFAPVDALEDHFHGDHWAVLEAEAVEFCSLLPEIVAGGVLRDPFEVPRLYLPPEEPHGINLTWPVPREGVVVAVRIGRGEDPNEVMGVYPRIQLGTQHRVAIERVYPWEGLVEGQIEAILGDAVVTFFDVFYATHKWCYRAGREYEFILTGLAYDCRVVDSEPMAIRDPEAVRVFAEASGRPGDGGSPVEIQTRGMAMLLPLAKGDRDDYQFQGPVKEVTATDFLGRAVWRLRVTVLRRLADNADIDLDVYAAPRCFPEDRPPRVGDDVRGVLWLQGYLWMVPYESRG